MLTVPAIICPHNSCSVLQVTGIVDLARITLDPAFDLLVPRAQLSLPTLGGADTLEASDSAGAVIVHFVFNAIGPYQLDIPISPVAAQSIRFLRVSNSAASAVQTATIHGVATADVVGYDQHTVAFAWNAQLFPTVRISMRYRPGDQSGREPIVASGSSSYQQVTLATPAHHLIVDFSDGVRSEQQTFTVFGR